MRGVGHIGRKGTTTVKHACAVLRAVPAHRLHEVGNLLFLEILGFVSKDIDIGGTGEGGGAVERAEPNIHAGKEDDGALVGDQAVEWLPEMGLQPVGEVLLLAVGKGGRLFLDDVMNTLAEAFAFEAFENGGENVGGEVAKRVGYPDARSAGHIVHHFDKAFDLHVGGLGRATSEDSKKASRHDQGDELAKRFWYWTFARLVLSAVTLFLCDIFKYFDYIDVFDATLHTQAAFLPLGEEHLVYLGGEDIAVGGRQADGFGRKGEQTVLLLVLLGREGLWVGLVETQHLGLLHEQVAGRLVILWRLGRGHREGIEGVEALGKLGAQGLLGDLAVAKNISVDSA